MSEWLCTKDYVEACKAVGRELEIKTLLNHLNSPCTMCGKVADHLVAVKTYNGIPLHKDDIIIGEKNN